MTKACALFRVASRELFNHYFRIHDDPYSNSDRAWLLMERFEQLERLLFKKLVVKEAGIADIGYGRVHSEITVTCGEGAPLMINREINSGYWDYPLEKISGTPKLQFIGFFDWDVLGIRDNGYVHVQIADWPGHPEVTNKHALIHSHYVSFVKDHAPL